MYINRTLVALFLLIGLLSTSMFAQVELGASFELRDEEPKGGFGVRVEKPFLQQIPFVDIGLRAHVSFFSDENSASQNGITYSQDLTSYDFGVAVTGGISVGLAEPYVGFGLGSTTIDIEPREVQGISLSDENESNIYWSGLIGAKVTIIPVLKPFIEYRYSNSSLSKPEVAELSTGRIIFGVVLSF